MRKAMTQGKSRLHPLHRFLNCVYAGENLNAALKGLDEFRPALDSLQLEVNYDQLEVPEFDHQAEYPTIATLYPMLDYYEMPAALAEDTRSSKPGLVDSCDNVLIIIQEVKHALYYAEHRGEMAGLCEFTSGYDLVIRKHSLALKMFLTSINYGMRE